jgi:hypothetical protein
LTGGGTTQTRCPGEEEEGGAGEEEDGGGTDGELWSTGRRAEQGHVGSVVWRRDCLGGGELLPYILSECGGRVMAARWADGLHGLVDVSFLPFWHCIIGLFFYFYILVRRRLVLRFTA